MRHVALIFFALNFALSWAVLGVYGLAKAGHLPAGLQVVGLIAKFGPSIAGVLVAAWFLGPRAVDGLMRRATDFSRPRWWIGAIAIPPLFLAAAYLIELGWRGMAPAISLAPLLLYGPRLALHVFLGGGLGEEFGWRGVALPLLQRRMSALGASLVIGILWAFWHLPAYLIEGEPELVSRFTIFSIAVIGISVIFTWLYNSTRGSLAVVILAHGAVNAAEWVMRRVLLGGEDSTLGDSGLAILFSLSAILLVVRYGARNLSSRPRVIDVDVPQTGTFRSHPS